MLAITTCSWVAVGRGGHPAGGFVVSAAPNPDGVGLQIAAGSGDTGLEGFLALGPNFGGGRGPHDDSDFAAENVMS